MTTPNEAEKQRNIETVVGSRINKEVVEAHGKGISSIAEDPIEAAEARRFSPLSRIEFTVRCDSFGNPTFQTIVPGMTEAKRGKLYERWNHPADIFAVRDRIIEIIEAYEEGGVQYQHRIAAVKQENLIDKRLQEGPIDPEERQALIDQTIEAMAEVGYTSSVYPERVKTAEQLVRAVELDILGRPNNSRGRMIVASRKPQKIKDALVAGDILKKNKRRLSVIEGACDLIEVDFGVLERFADNLAQTPVGTGAFDEELVKFKRAIELLLSPKRAVLPKPYSGLGAKIRYAMHSARTLDDPSVLGRYMNPQEALEVVEQFSTGFASLRGEKEDLRPHRVGEVARLITDGLQVIRERRAAKSTDEELAETDKWKPAPSATVEETPTEKRRRLRLAREWRWIDQGVVDDKSDTTLQIDES